MQAAGCRVSAVLDNNALQTFPSIPKKNACALSYYLYLCQNVILKLIKVLDTRRTWSEFLFVFRFLFPFVSYFLFLFF